MHTKSRKVLVLAFTFLMTVILSIGMTMSVSAADPVTVTASKAPGYYNQSTLGVTLSINPATETGWTIYKYVGSQSTPPTPNDQTIFDEYVVYAPGSTITLNDNAFLWYYARKNGTNTARTGGLYVTAPLTANPTSTVYNASNKPNNFKVTLSANPNNNITIYYRTFDATATPPTNYSVYSNSSKVQIALQNNTTKVLQYYLKYDYGNIHYTSEVLEERYTVDAIAPTIVANPPTGTYNAAQTVTLSDNPKDLSGVANIYYTTNGSTPTTGSYRYTAPITLPNQTTTNLKCIAVDNAGNTSGVFTFTYTLDKVKPVVSANLPDNSAYNQATNVTLTSTKTGSRIYYTLDGNDPIPSGNGLASPAVVALPNNQTTVLKCISVDTVGNVSNMLTRTYTVDTLAPTVQANPPADGPKSRPIGVTLTATDALSGPARIYYTSDESDPTYDANYNPTGNTVLYTAGSVLNISSNTVIKYVAVDKLGNRTAVQTAAYVIELPKITSISLAKAGDVSADGKYINLKVDVAVNHPQDLLYQIWLEDNTGWELVRGYEATASDVIKVERTKDDNYKVQVRIKGSDTSIVYDQKIEVATCKDLGIARIDKVTTTGNGKGVANSPVTITALASKGLGQDLSGLLYSFDIKDSNGTIANYPTSFEASNTNTWIPTVPGKYMITAIVKDGTQTHEMSVSYEVLAAVGAPYVYPELSDITITGPNNGAKTIQALSAGNDGWLYGFFVGEPTIGMRMPLGYSTAKSYPWTAPGTGVFEVLGTIKTDRSVAAEDEMRRYIRVSNPNGNIGLSLSSSDEDLSIAKGEKVVITSTATRTSENGLLYAYIILDSRGHRLVQEYSEKNTFEWQPARSGKYKIYARVKEKDVSASYEDSKSIEFTVTDDQVSPISDVGLAITGDLKARNEIKLTASATSTSENLMYAFAISNEDSGWKILQHFSTDDTYTWMPNKPGTYKLIVWVKEAVSGAREVEYTQDVTVTR